MAGKMASLLEETKALETPVFILDMARLKQNLEKAASLKKAAGCKILLALKGFAMPQAFPLMARYLDGTTASGEYEARLGAEEFCGEVHAYSPAYREDEVKRLTQTADHIYFNSAEQLARLGPIAKQAGRKIGLRINPGFSNATIGGDLYNPCAPCSRFGEVPERFSEVDWSIVDLIHVHALCESLHDGSVALINHVAAHFGEYIAKVKAVNFGGGHFIGKQSYDIAPLADALAHFQTHFDVETYLEPGGGLVVDAGELIASVLALHHNDKPLAILDTSASTHMPDILEAPYRPEIIGAGAPGEHAHSYVLGGKTCMTGDVIGEYSFAAPLSVGDRLVFTDQMHYSFVKTNTFNGMPLPALAMRDLNGEVSVIKKFDYHAFRDRLGSVNTAKPT